jgi:3-methyl-2-oxobutanoate hydroxymethyltransferase
LEGGAAVSHIIKAISDVGIPVQAHIGLLPQSLHMMGGYRVQRDEERLMADARDVEAAGAFSVVLEGIPADISGKITQAISIPTIGIGAGPHCDGQILVLHDLLGIHDRHLPKFVKQYARIKDAAAEGIKSYIREVTEGDFPTEDQSY